MDINAYLKLYGKIEKTWSNGALVLLVSTHFDGRRKSVFQAFADDRKDMIQRYVGGTLEKITAPKQASRQLPKYDKGENNELNKV